MRSSVPTTVDHGLCGALLSVLDRILKRVEKWAAHGKMRSFVKQTEIRMELEDSYRELQTCSMRFNVRRLSLLSSPPFMLLADRLASESKQPSPRARGNSQA